MGSKHFTLYSLAELFIQTPSRLLWEVHSFTSINMWINMYLTCTQISTAIYSQVLIHFHGNKQNVCHFEQIVANCEENIKAFYVYYSQGIYSLHVYFGWLVCLFI